MTTESTREWIERAQAGDREAFDRVAQQFRSRLSGFTRLQLGQHLRHQVDVEDILQETFLKAFQSIDSFRWESDASLFGWLCGIARNEILRQTRRYLKVEAVEFDETAGPGSPPSGGLRRDERWRRLREAIQSLSPDHRQVITLARIDGVPVNEIAKRMNRSPKATYQLLWRALRKLRETFGDTESLSLPDRNLRTEGFEHDEE